MVESSALLVVTLLYRNTFCLVNPEAYTTFIRRSVSKKQRYNFKYNSYEKLSNIFTYWPSM